MEEPIQLMRNPSTKLVLRVGSRFLYEVTLHKYYKDRVELADSRFYSSKKIVKYKSPVITKMDDCLLIKNIDLLEAPLDYLLSNGYKEIDATNKRQKTKRKIK